MDVPGTAPASVDLGPSPLPPPEAPDGRTALERLRAQMTAGVAEARAGKEGVAPRDEGGRFVKREATGEAEEPAAAAGPDGGGDAPAMPDTMRDIADAGEFEFAGEKFKDRAAAEQRFKTALGMVKAADKRARAALQAVQEYEAFIDQHQIGRGGQAPEGAERPSGDEEATAAFVDSLGQEGWQQFENYRQEKGEAFAHAWLLDRVEGHISQRLSALEGRIRAEFEQKYPWISQQNETLETIHNVTQLWGEFQDMADDDGNPRYPELGAPDGDHAALRQRVAEIGTIWRSFVERASDPRDPYWMDQAITEYRRQKANGRPRGNGGGADKLDNLRRAAQQRGAGAVDGNGAPIREKGPQTPEARAAADLARSFTPDSQRAGWGFSA